MRFAARVLIFFMASFFGTKLSYAKGLDGIEPSPAVENGDQGATSELGRENEVEASATDGEQDLSDAAATADEVVEVPPVTRSAASKRIEDKLMLQSSLNWAHLGASHGEWQAGAATELTVGYRLSHKYRDVAFWTLLRYVAIDVTSVVATQSYRGIAESYALGGMAQFPVRKGLSAFAAIDVGYMQIGLNESDNVATTENNEFHPYGAQYGFSTGLSWSLMDKVEMGPRLAMSFGVMQVVEAGGQIKFVF